MTVKLLIKGKFKVARPPWSRFWGTRSDQRNDVSHYAVKTHCAERFAFVGFRADGLPRVSGMERAFRPQQSSSVGPCHRCDRTAQQQTHQWASPELGGAVRWAGGRSGGHRSGSGPRCFPGRTGYPSFRSGPDPRSTVPAMSDFSHLLAAGPCRQPRLHSLCRKEMNNYVNVRCGFVFPRALTKSTRPASLA